MSSLSKPLSTRDRVYETLRENIITLKFKPGSSISEKEISEWMEVSRTPVREAFQKLEQDYLLEILPQRGSIVTLIDSSHVEDARFIREHLEVASVRLACSHFDPEVLDRLTMNLRMQELFMQEKKFDKLFHLDEEFHALISEGCGKARVWDVISQVNIHLDRVRMLSLTAEYNWKTLLQHHTEILKAVKQGDADTAANIMRKHLSLVSVDQVALKESFPAYFK
ncbi:DNA-binding GntR family transcriptional regulator [Geomicrobium halophilum]|uniref:DNA-binding GntR family transcriptional regulator n=1 Tax=Geomicrobium halophilum TaxID=549000 RepID=A0A841PW95_9BACL|nr:GntR family transcriptional regulator [Geomicrobium halophilum]MBB6448085.1 DNA-binding GntR family transcriptional regulator [Geomicrobium halophilum]